MKRYDPSEIEPKWQRYWQEHDFFAAKDLDKSKPKFYAAEMFPYPSGDGLHVGHVRNFTIVDVIARYKAQQGYNVLRPFGYDTFGLPAENYAIKTGLTPQDVTQTNIANFRNQAQRLGFAIDWSRELNTSDPEYYRWTQWIFGQLYKKGLAYKKESYQWWCNFDKTVLANEQVEGGKCWRCGKEVEKKKMSQWYFKITEYADELLESLDDLDWPEKIKVQQRNWIGRSVGAEIDFRVSLPDLIGQSRNDELGSPIKSANDAPQAIKVFTTRPDTIFGATFMVLAPEHPSVVKITTDEQRGEITKYQEATLKKSEIQRQENKDKTGVFTGAYALNPANGEKIPIWIADYVLPDYGEGAIMAVPAHDERDYEFAAKFGIPIRQVVAPIDFDAEYPPIEGKPNTKRQVVNMLVKHPEKDEYLTVIHPKRGWHDFPMGGIEEGETPELAARRELAEETGYTNLKLVSTMPIEINAIFYAAHKDVNRDIMMTTLLFELENLEQQETQLDTVEQAEDLQMVWTPRAELKNLAPVNGLDYILDWLDNKQVCFTGEGVMMNSGEFTGLLSAEAGEKITKWLASRGVARRKVQYKMRDWLISRQRYWGCPIPIGYDREGQTHLIPDDQLPVVLPKIDDYQPDESGHSALAKDREWLKVEINGETMTRETDTLDGYACSSWYLLRYADPHNSKAAWDKDLANFWNPVDCYVGADHAVAHLLYVRFWCKVFADLGLVSFREPVKRLIYHGYINDEKNKKMSKSKGNVIDPLDIINSGYGADTLRTYEMFIAPYEMDAPWSTAGVGGVYRFLTRVWNLTQGVLDSPIKSANDELLRIQHKTIKKVTEDIERNSFNTAVAALMEYSNYLAKHGATKSALANLGKLLMPFAPHLASEMLESLGESPAADWPKWDEKYLTADQATIAVQVSGKLRGEITLPIDSDETAAKAAALKLENVKNFVGDKKIAKTIYVKNKIVNFVVV